MTAILKVDTIQDTSGNNIINESSDTITIGASGDTIALAGTTVTGITQGITMADQWRLTAQKTDSTDITANLERVDNTSYAKIGTGMSESSGIFTFPSTGLYLVRFTGYCAVIPDDNILGYIMTTTNNSSYATDANWIVSGDGSSTGYSSVPTEYLFNVTNTSTHKVKFNMVSIGSGSLLDGNTNINLTNFTFIRLGDSQ